MLRLFVLLSLLSAFIISCGSKNKKSSDVRNTEEINPDDDIPGAVWSFIQGQKAKCEDPQLCPESVAKIVVLGSKDISYCTGVLVDSETVVTSASCLERELKIPGADCSKDVFFIFPETNSKQRSISTCSHVFFSDLNTEVDVALWKSDLTFFKLRSKVTRKPMDINEKGLLQEDAYTYWAFDYIDESEGILRSKSCYPIYSSYVNPMANQPNSPMMPFAGCKFNEGNAGAVILNSENKVAAISSGSVNQELVDFVSDSGLLEGELLEIQETTNLSCHLDYGERFSQNMDTSILSSECKNTLDQEKLDRSRSNLIFGESVHFELVNNILAKTNSDEFQYLDFNFEFSLISSSVYKRELVLSAPNCFKNISEWRRQFCSNRRCSRMYTSTRQRFEFPYYILSVKFNPDMTISSYIEQEATREYSITFNPASAWRSEQSDVSVQYESIEGEDLQFDYEEIPLCL